MTPVASGGPWSVVGTGGKVAAAVARPPAVTQASVPAVSAARPAVVSAARTASTSQVAKAPKVDADPLPPSAEFLKWMRDSLSGLDSSIRCKLCLFRTLVSRALIMFLFL